MQAPCGVPSAAAIDRAVARFREAELRNIHVQIAPGPFAAEAEAAAVALGLVPYPRSWAKFTRAVEPASPPKTRLRVERVTQASSPVYGRVIARGFGMPDAMAPWLAAVATAPGFAAFMSFDGEEPVGGGALYLGEGGGGWLGMGATVPEARSLGGQAAILAARINHAVAAGARYLATETGTAVPGQPQASFRNIERAGFRVAYERPNWTWAQG